ncbi:MAG: DUF4105 domain-containing protein [Crocinitomicaceae bacterium]
MIRLLLICIFIQSFILKAEDPIRISLLTTDPGDLPHTLFGHSALRVRQGEDFDKIYNFGLFDFKTPNFGLKFLGGRLEYWLGRQSLDGFIEVNNKEQRIIREQVLDIEDQQALRIFELLKNRHTSEDRFYRYSFTFKNCTSEIRDIFINEGLISTQGASNRTYRQMINSYLDRPSWTRFGLNLVLGVEMDRKISYEESLFLPADLENAVENKDGLVLEHHVLNDPKPLEKPSWLRYLYSPFAIFSFLVILSSFWKPMWWRFTIYFIIGVMGVFISYLWMTTLHPEIQNNLNVFWCNPLFLLFFAALIIKRGETIIGFLIFGFLLLTILSWIFQIQHFEWAVLPISILLFQFVKKDLTETELAKSLKS